MPSITPCLWFDANLEEAATFYTGIFPNSSVGHLARMPDGSALAGDFNLDGLTFQGINGGPMFAQFTEAISFSISCADQVEVDHYWDSLVDGGTPSMCGWLKDRFGLSWQIVPRRLIELLSDPDPARAQAAQAAMLGMQKIVVADLEAAAKGASV
ncbi:putative 3-demethylubiquinone-9 3-methyltransferase [Nocardioides psychrotolerans]|uniref:Glyoxalase superfamily enzyme, possibly 3-demethylubiquinone-9 3-methyltransferase n=1 Tax=Nocardioides psychrotolerans TaxID=1005945 RepID=A0A1I3P092_9ACTN|nr:VOC family protein [Nocardioides psychrotolerans]GEP39569.1 putative 3-demethylubiquinone-9 3-methyltransferase [Nocardioides psychrotolerans]SFJ14817.1 Glyoxalase superfamily enzyme, possibly 3-demethylubiquinone-9 3-methyltransferase [Nocardioides psychrotolerans]